MVVCGFPGVGKTYAVKHWNHPDYKIYDSDSSDFSWIDKHDHSKGRNPDFPTNYIEHIKSLDNDKSFVLVSSHKDVRDALRKASINYFIVYPWLHVCDKDVYLRDRIAKRHTGINSDSFVKLLSDNWVTWIKEIDKEATSPMFRFKLDNRTTLHEVLDVLVKNNGHKYIGRLQ